MTTIIRRITAIATFFIAQITLAEAAELKVYSTIGVKSVLEELAPKFEKASGHKLNIAWGLISSFTKKAQEGDVPDVLIVSRASIESLIKDGKIAAGSGVTLGTSIVAVAVRKGAPKLDISTADALKKSLLAARAVSYSDPAAGGASGVHFAKVLERLGIAEQVKAKAKFPPPAGFVSNLLISGEVDIAVQTKPELMSVAGVEVVGPLPGDLSNTTVFGAGVGAGSKNSDAGKALLKFLTSPDAVGLFKAKGFDPA